jgi:PASTA domain/IPT/TIG domain
VNRGRIAALTAAIVAVLATCTGSAQGQVTIGEVAPPNPDAYCINGPLESIPGPASRSIYTAATNGVITSWSTNTTAGDGQMLTFKVYRRVDSNHYMVVGHDGPRNLAPSSLNTFKTAIPVQAGDVIGNNDLEQVLTAPSACLFDSGNAADFTECSETGDFPDGSIFETNPECDTEFRVNTSATLLPPPSIISLGSAGGPYTGGTSVVIAGANFAEVKGVSFGSVPASSFAVDSEGQITAVAPPSATLAKVNILVTTIAGTATSAAQFSYEGCTVPKLKGKKLKGSKKRVRKAGCKVGKVKKRGDATAKTGEVVKQRPKPGKLVPSGTKVKITLGE